MPIHNRAIVTGATSGIGTATVRTLAASGRQVLAVARREDRLQALAEETGAALLVSDVRNLKALREAIEKFEPDILVNNAGVGHGIDGLPSVDPELVQESVDINITAPIQSLFAHGLPMLLWRSSRIGCGPRQAVAGRSNGRT